jgi:hypothetical protein
MLSVSGQLDRQMGGPTIAPGTTEDYSYEHQEGRRSVYLPVLRNSLPEIFEIFNFADPSVVTGQRNSTTVAPQALYMLNHRFVYQQSRFAAQRLLALPIDDDRLRVERAYRMIVGRPPSTKEAEEVLNYLESAAADEEEDTWTDIVQALFSSLDFQYLH